MKLILRLFAGHLVVCTAALSVGLWIGASPAAAVAACLVGGLWFLSVTRNAHGMETVYLLSFELAAAAGFYWFSLPPYLALITSVSAVAAWDLDHFLQRIRAADRVDQEHVLSQDHLRRLGLVEGIGIALGIVALLVRLTLPFWLAIVLVILGLTGISQLIIFVRKQAE